MSKELTFNGQEIIQPKRQAIEIVGAEGIPTPINFSTLEDARIFVSQGGEAIVRSESPSEWDGASGLRTSQVIHKIDNDKCYDPYELDFLVPSIFGGPDLNQEDRRYLTMWVHKAIASKTSYSALKKGLNYYDLAKGLKKYYRYLDLSYYDMESRIADLSHSFWQYIPGIMQTVACDSVYPERSYVWSKSNEDGNAFAFQRFDGDKLTFSYGSLSEGKMQQASAGSIEIANHVRNMKAFGIGNAPLVETVTDNKGNTHFLQIHPNRAMGNVVASTLSNPNALWARGAMDTCELPFFHGVDDRFGMGRQDRRNFSNPFAFAYQRHDHPLSEFLIGQGGVAIIPVVKFGEVVGQWNTHLAMSTMFKPPASMMVHESEIGTNQEFGWGTAIVGADGNNGFFKLIQN